MKKYLYLFLWLHWVLAAACGQLGDVWVPEHAGSVVVPRQPPVGDGACVLCTARGILSNWTTTEVPGPWTFNWSFLVLAPTCTLSHLIMTDSLWPVDCSPPDSSVRGILQARILEWTAMPSSRGSSWPRVWTSISCVSCIGRQILYHWHHLGSPTDIYILLYIK